MQVLVTEEATLKMPDMTDDEFFDFCHDNNEYRIERSATGVVTIMPGTGGRTGFRNIRISRYLDLWAEQDGTGLAFDSSTMFRLPDGAMRSPDGSWLAKKRLASVASDQLDRFIPLCPDFVIELCSPSDRLGDAQEKMAEWMANGALLGWLLHPATKTAYVYRPEQPVTILTEPGELVGTSPVAGFRLPLKDIWEPGW